MIELKNVTIKTRHTILNKVNYTFHDHTIYGIVAINGSGKTTLFRTLMNLLKVEEGSILFDGVEVEEMLQKVFYFETIEWLDRNLSGLDYLKFVKSSWKSSIDINEVIELCNMEEYIKIPIRKYSFGMKQRLIIGMYLISDAMYMIMDEITTGLDEEHRNRFFELVKDMKQKGKTIILSSHYKEEIIEICDCVLEIRNEDLSELSS